MKPKTLYNIKTCGLLLLLLVPLYPMIAITVVFRIIGRAMTLAGRLLEQAGGYFREVPEYACPKVPLARKYADWIYKKLDSVEKPVDS